MRLALMLLSGCLLDVERGPFVGECAEYPDHPYGFGDIGIGTCLAGPTDVRFWEDGDTTWLLVPNADPYQNFLGGSLLLIDWDSIDLTVDENRMDDLDAVAFETDRFVGQVGVVPSRRLALVASRLSQEARTRDHDDTVLVVDLDDPTDPKPWEEGAEIAVKDDPYHIEVDELAGEAYVVNLTDHSISVLDLDDTPITAKDLAPPPDLGSALFTDADASGSVAELVGPSVTEADNLVDDRWTLSYADGTWRLFWPDDFGYTRHTSGDGVSFAASGLTDELSPAISSEVDEVVDAYLDTANATALVAWFSDGGTLRAATPLSSALGDWGLVSGMSLPGGTWDVLRGGPSVSFVEQDVALFYDGRAADGQRASIGLLRSQDGITFSAEGDPVLEPEGDASYEDPFVLPDPHTGGLRMWFSHWDGSQWAVAVTDSFDGTDWSEPEDVLEVPGGDAAAPVVTWANGRYLLWASTGDTTFWALSHAWSWDGKTWYDLTEALPFDGTFDRTKPPRAMLQADPTGLWSIEGEESGPVSFLVGAGGGVLELEQRGFGLGVSGGHAVPLDVLGDVAVNGMRPGAFATVNGRATLYVTALDGDARPRISILQELAGTWRAASLDVIPSGTGGNAGGVQSPVVTGTDGDWTLFYAATDDAGITRIRRARSVDGISFLPEPGLVVETEANFDALSQLPHSLEVDGDDWRLWYAGDNGTRFRIGAARSTDGGATFQAEPGPNDEFHLGTGQPGDFDDTGVRDPLVLVEDGVTRMYYAGSDGTNWHIGYAELDGDTWERPVHPLTDRALPALSGALSTFSAAGVSSPVAGDGGEFWYAGSDGFLDRLGNALRDETEPRVLYAAQSFPTVGDTLVFDTQRGDFGDSVIELQQTVESFSTSGIGAAGLIRDPMRGMLYVASKLSTAVYVADVRDDSTDTFDDRNAYDLEGMLSFTSHSGTGGFRGGIAAGSRLYLSSTGPEGVLVADLASVVDDEHKTLDEAPALALLPMDDQSRDPGADTLTTTTAAGMALHPDGRTLLVTHLRGNAVTVFDLGLGPFGSEVRLLSNIGENPHVVRISPDGKYAVVANYVGEVDEFTTSGSLAVIDVDPTSPTYLEPLTWLVNQ